MFGKHLFFFTSRVSLFIKYFLVIIVTLCASILLQDSCASFWGLWFGYWILDFRSWSPISLESILYKTIVLFKVYLFLVKITSVELKWYVQYLYRQWCLGLLSLEIVLAIFNVFFFLNPKLEDIPVILYCHQCLRILAFFRIKVYMEYIYIIFNIILRVAIISRKFPVNLFLRFTLQVAVLRR